MQKQTKINIAIIVFVGILLLSIFLNVDNQQKFVKQYETLYSKQLKEQEQIIKSNQEKIDSLSKSNQKLEESIKKTNEKIDRELNKEIVKIKKKYEKDSIVVSNYSTDKSIEFLSDYLSSKTK